MALPSSGPLSFSVIAGAVGASTPYSLRSMSATAGFSTPDAVSEFYGYSPAPTTATLNIQVVVNNYSSYSNFDIGTYNGFYIYDMTSATYVYERYDISTGVTYNDTVTLTVGHSYNYAGYAYPAVSVFVESGWFPVGSNITLNEDCIDWTYGYGQDAGNFTVNSGGTIDMIGEIAYFDSGTETSVCTYP